MEGISLTRELAWLQLCKELFAQIPKEQREGLLRNLPLDGAALKQFGLIEESAVILKIIEVKAYEIDANKKGLTLIKGEKVKLYEHPLLWCSLLQQLAFLSENQERN